jgi:hypothetical protein
MKPNLALAFVLVVLVCHAFGQSIQLQGSQLALPEGNVIGAAFDHDRLFIQQSVLRAEGPKVRSERQILSWSVSSNTVVKTRTLTGSESVLPGNRCGNVQVDANLQRIFVCSSDSTLATLDSMSLQTMGSINCKR